MEEQKRVYKIKNKIGYGLGDMYAGGAFLLVSLLYLNFLTDVVGFAPKIAGLVFIIGKIWDAISDPLMGNLSDNTRSKLGRRRIFFAIGIIPVFLSFLLLWLNIGTDSTWSIVYYIFAYIFFNTSFTLVMVPYNGLLPNMVKEYKDRTSFNTYRMVFSSFSAILSGVVPMMIIKGYTNESTGYLIMGIVFGLIYALPWIGVLFLTWENPIDQNLEKQSLKDLVKEMKLSFRNKSFRKHASFFVSAQTAVDFLTTLFIYYLTYVLNRESEFSYVLGALLITQLVCMPFHGVVSKKFGKRMPMVIGMSSWIIGLIIALFITKDSPSYLIYIVSILSGVGGSSAIFVPWSILPEISDVDEIMTGRRREGIYAGVSTFNRKIAQAISVYLIGLFLDIIGYIPNVTQTLEVQRAITGIFVVAPLIFIVLALFFVSRYKMTEEKHEILMTEIANRKQTHKASNDHIVIEVCEELTGLNYNELNLFNE